MTTIVPALVPVFLLIAAGVLCRRYLIPEPQGWVGLERLVYYVLFPALLIQTLARADLTRVPVGHVTGALFGALVVITLLCLAIRPALARRLSLGGPAFTSVFQGATRWNTFVVLAIVGNLYGEFGIALASVAIGATIPALNVLNVWVLAAFASADAASPRRVARALVVNPFIWACSIGALLNVLAVPIPAPIQAFASALGSASLALGVMMVGAGLQPRRLLRPDGAAWVASALKLVLMPAMSIALGRALGLEAVSLAVVACCAAVPSASSAYVLARQMGGDAELMAQILTLQTLLATVTMPVAMAAVA